MVRSELTFEGISFPVVTCAAAVVGSGCAGLNAADTLHALGVTDLVLLTEGLQLGTSRNTGSDKQTYYKLSLAGEQRDSVMDMARDLFSGGGVNGGTALAEAACSARAFMKLVELGVPFPTNRYGEYVGYRTDHDQRTRATSAGPLTSRYMVECLERSVRARGVPVMEQILAFSILRNAEGGCGGLLCIDKTRLNDETHGLLAVQAPYVVWATGGPAGCYRKTVYPASQFGMSGALAEAGAAFANLDQWQYGLSSVKHRWNVSGTYQQALPRYFSVDRAGVQREFLADAYPSPADALNDVFLKGYQWPFDGAKAAGSTRIDILVHRETAELGRRVYLDYRQDPAGLAEGFDGLSAEARAYLSRSGALLKTPVARLAQMNAPAIELYRAHGIDLYSEPLEIAVCAQHHNGGAAVDADWQTGIPGLYAVGEAAGTFGLRRPGGSALNAAQVGALRASEHIARQAGGRAAPIDRILLGRAIFQAHTQLSGCLARGKEARIAPVKLALRLREGMSACAAHIRDREAMRALDVKIGQLLDRYWAEAGVDRPAGIPLLLRTRDMMLAQRAILSAMLESAERFGSRGSALVLAGGGASVYEPTLAASENLLLSTVYDGREMRSSFQPVQPLPAPDEWFETVWADYRARTDQTPRD